MIRKQLLEDQDRIKIHVKFDKSIINRVCLIDTGCSTTMIDIRLARLYGKELAETLNINLGRKKYTAQGYQINKLVFGEFYIENIFMFAVDFTQDNELYFKILLGLNVLNNFDYIVNRNKGVFEFTE